MMKRVPKAYLRGKKKQVFKLTYKLQERWTGPFRIVKVISPILYDLTFTEWSSEFTR